MINGQEVPVLEASEVITTYRHKTNGEVFKDRKGWESKGYKEEDMAQDVSHHARSCFIRENKVKHIKLR